MTMESMEEICARLKQVKINGMTFEEMSRLTEEHTREVATKFWRDLYRRQMEPTAPSPAPSSEPADSVASDAKPQDPR